MAHNRLEKIGTIYSRITGLVKTGAMKLEERPLWYQIYQAFPPEKEPRFNRDVTETQIRKIFYPEDIIRAKFYKKVSHVPTINLFDRQNNTLCQKFIDLCFQMQKEQGTSLDEVFDEAFERLRVDLLDSSSQTPSHESTKQAPTSTITVANILKDS